jgi:hypothetical protein
MSDNRLETIYANLVENIFLEEKTMAVEQAITDLATDVTVRAEMPELDGYLEAYTSARNGSDDSEREYALLNLYLRLHIAGSRYSSAEREALNTKSGISCQPGGLSPLIMAEEFIGPETVVADLGAGNGLQGLLLQRIRPHRKTVQIELSKELIRMGRMFQKALGISDERVEWVNEDMAEASVDEADFVYIYRPAKPHGGGNELYRTIADKLAASPGPLVIFSVADCLGRFLDKQFSVFYTNGHLTCFRKK